MRAIVCLDPYRQAARTAPPPRGRTPGAVEELGSTAGPPPRPAASAGPVALGLLYLALALGAVAVVGGSLQAAGRLRSRRRPATPLSARR